MIDTSISLEHETLSGASIELNYLTNEQYSPVTNHGTAVASILIGQKPGFTGLLPGAQLWSASVFFDYKQRSEITTAEYLVKAIDWMIANKVDVVNMSLAGPANAVLERTIQKACDNGLIIVAAAGNNGPNSKPLYPAAYECVLAVTAIDNNNRVYRRANRGEHIDIAAYGVNLLHANAVSESGLTRTSGTSLASAIVAAYISTQPNTDTTWQDHLYSNCVDAGPEGHDPIYGCGVLKLNSIVD
jgi:subtilisin family serine protease